MKAKILIPALLLLLVPAFLTLGCGGSSGGTGGVQFSGTVTDGGKALGDPISGVNVCAGGSCDQTDTFGGYVFTVKDFDGGDIVFTFDGDDFSATTVVRVSGDVDSVQVEFIKVGSSQVNTGSISESGDRDDDDDNSSSSGDQVSSSGNSSSGDENEDSSSSSGSSSSSFDDNDDDDDDNNDSSSGSNSSSGGSDSDDDDDDNSGPGNDD